MKTFIISVVAIIVYILLFNLLGCKDLDANCDGEINIVDMSIFLAKAEQVTHNGND